MSELVWSDPGDWVSRLHAKLEKLDLQYQGHRAIERMAIDPDELGNPELVEEDARANATLAAAGSLSSVVSALKEIPSFQGNIGLVALEDLLAALMDLDAGGRPKMLEPRPDTKNAPDGIARRLVKANVVFCMKLMAAAGQHKKLARETVAEIFAKAGHRGRKGNPLSPKTLYDWSVELSPQGSDAGGRAIVDRAIAEWKSMHPWPPTLAVARQFTVEKASDPRLLSKI